jgi:capsid portal protein
MDKEDTTRELSRRDDPPEAADLELAYAMNPAAAMGVISDSVDGQSAHDIDIEKASAPSSQAPNDPLSTGPDGPASLISPIYNFTTLIKTIEGSSELRQVIAAMVANTILYGYRMVKRDHDPIDIESPEFLDEQIEFENFAAYCGKSSDMLRVMEELAWDFYLTGNAFCEVVRSPATKQKDSNGKTTFRRGRIVALYRLPVQSMRMSREELTPHTQKVKLSRRTRDGYVVREGFDSKRFRKYAQINKAGISALPDSSQNRRGNHIWFSEFQDSRFYARDTGEEIKGNRKISSELKAGNVANEVIHISSSTTRDSYGFPYYIGNLSSVAADIAIDNINLATIRNNMIPSMVVMVSGNGGLTKSSWKRITDFTKAKFTGQDNRSRFLVLEGESLGDAIDEDNGNVRVDIKSLHETQHNDQMFQEYSDNARASVRRSFRLPEILVGRGEAASGVVVAASMKLADEQVFAQDRDLFVDWINRRLLPEMGIAHLQMELNSPNATDPDTLNRLLTASERTGSMTPRISHMILSRILGTDLPPLPEKTDDFDPDLPFTHTMAKAVKKVNEAGKNNPTGTSDPESESNGADPTEPGQTVTASPGRPDGEKL